jgi:hypothetical protein
MRIFVHKLLENLGTDIYAAESSAVEAQSQVTSLEAVVNERGLAKGAAYEGFRDYIFQLRIPIAKLHMEFFSCFAVDMRSDKTALSNLPCDRSGIIDTEAIHDKITTINDSSNDLRNWINDWGKYIPGAVMYCNWAIEANNEAVYHLNKMRAEAYAYANNSIIYAASKKLTIDLASSSQSLSEVVYNPATSSYDLSGINDISWMSTLDSKYWECYNRVLLSKYFDLDEYGNIIGIKAEAKDELASILNKLTPYLGLSGKGLDLSQVGNFADGLSYEDKYVMLYLMATYGDDVFKAEQEFAYSTIRGLEKVGINPDGTIKTIFDFLDFCNIDLVSNYLSFDYFDGKLTGLDSPNSFQANGGFSDMFDLATKFLGMDIDTQITVFQYEGQEYRLQVWDGQYMAGAYYGGEIGLYSRPIAEAQAMPYIDKDPEEYVQEIKLFIPTEVNNMFIQYSSVKGDEQIPMVLKVYRSDGTPVIVNDTSRYTEDGVHFWDFAVSYNGDLNYSKQDLHIVGELTFDDPGMRAVTKKALQDDGYQVNEHGNILTVAWE